MKQIDPNKMAEYLGKIRDYAKTIEQDTGFSLGGIWFDIRSDCVAVHGIVKPVESGDEPSPLIGRRIRLKTSKDLFSENDIVPAGVTGTIVEAGADMISVQLDLHRASLDHWDNELYWYPDHTGNIPELFDRFHAEVEFI